MVAFQLMLQKDQQPSWQLVNQILASRLGIELCFLNQSGGNQRPMHPPDDIGFHLHGTFSINNTPP